MPDRSIDVRGYQDRGDLALLLEFASRCFAERFPLSAQWHPGDFVWELKPEYDRPHRLRMWLSRRGIEAVSMFMSANTLWLEVLPQSEDLLPEIIARAERSRNPKLSIRAFENDSGRIATLEALGYGRGEPEGVWFRADLSKPLPDFAPPAGFRVRDSVDVDPARRAAAHRDAWNDLSQIGIEGAQSSFATEVYLALKSAPLYDPSLDLLVENESGEVVANCICWADERSRIGIFEPTGTNPAYRRRGLMRFAMLEGLNRLKARGMRHAGVGTAHFNAPAIATYRSIFAPLDRTSWWTKSLRAGP